MRIRLTAKITVLIILVLIVGFGIATILTIKRESELLVEQNKMAARQLIGTLVSSIETAMLSERPDITRGIIADLRNSKLVQGLVVYRRNGVEAFTDLATLREVSKEAELPKDVMASAVRASPGRTWTAACTRSPHSSSGTPKTAASSTFGWRCSTSSISAG